ncbi:MAG: LacI family transcriptional regulator [Ignavibacteria bacterium CG_4_10_14_3_um_filter_37_18]|nr:MAG: LacI family transcriptional regulator [Ignavibacteria bacterium CG_4_10_14_3_um_filter_37_18]PJC58225.1 MAG: LacI family transcriptional regulator [Ignavibacteria bacterium CG_4_9_14_0_2_um_filter_37_13]
MKSTIKDVAKKANVSIATVSFVINNSKPISEETKDRVQKAIKSLNYYPSKSAVSLVSGKTGNIGFILTDDHFLRTEPFYTTIFLGTEFEARSEGYYIILTSIKPNFTENDMLPRFILNKSVDGIIIAGKIPQILIEKISAYHLPTVFIDYIPSTNSYPLVLIDNIQGALLATNHLIDLGHKNIAFIGGDIEHPSLSHRLIGYKQALERANIPIKNSLIITDAKYPDRQNGFHSAEKLFSKNKNVTAVFAGNDALAIGILHYLKDNGYKVPQDVSLIGFDDIEADIMLRPTLTTIRVPKIEMGSEALKLIVTALKNKNSIIKKVLVPVELIVRESTSRCKPKQKIVS